MVPAPMAVRSAPVYPCSDHIVIEDHAQREHLPVRFCATKLIEGDEPILKALHLDQNEVETLEHIITQMEQERGH